MWDVVILENYGMLNFITDFSKNKRKSNKLLILSSRHTTSRGCPLWSYFGRDVPDHDRTKIWPAGFLTCFGCAMSDIHLASGNIERFPYKPILWIMINLTSRGPPKDATLRVLLWDVFKTFSGRFSRTERICNN